MVQVSGFGVGTFSVEGVEFPGLVVGERVLDLREFGGSVLSLLERWDEVWGLLLEVAEDGEGFAGGSYSLGEVRVCAPLAPRQIFQSGANYRTHVIDLAVAHRVREGDTRPLEELRAEAAEFMDGRAAGEPYLFLGLPSAVTGPYDDVVLPAWCEQGDWELELAAVIGRVAFRVSVDEALSFVAGYTIANDLTAREAVFRQDAGALGADWFRSKNAPTFLPLGPYVVPSAFVDPGDLRVRLTLNGEVMQDESTADMIFDVARLVSAASQVTPLLPGDLVMTGSPAGNGLHWGRLLRPGDVMEGSITGLGVQRNRCVAEEVR
ncbi:fumarylacetoacetate hydrolase family protein [Thermomonospora cellulosilytica]|uniref:2-keto-4-pentenoate hydratase/2-oxohepta-3-ene-1,7-dioic acid hydratase in catechol pathway n=1 Tax=Thermomonospora cellulosilytica TaxID=1411118 RepID=A0A7W3N3C3_9ACTN|nr:fumarylacetoacetate hydrolase family protein [Thermomonospora cellulosilytica]MBA9006803.1 2-keto-4-pentenoate hydratase/2-oxohepta-3-ene-1,7-dioic acid hydratase in catechol pathway [Thermomonospora cellulosilytica]